MSRERERALFPGIAGALGLVAAVLAAEVVVTILARRSFLSATDSAVQAFVVAMVLGNGAVLAIYLGRRRLRLRDVLHPASASVAATFGVLAVPVLLVVPGVFLGATALDDVLESVFPMSDSQRRMFAELVRSGFASTVALVLAAPFFEELVFRGIVLRGLLARMPPHRAIAISALIFGAAHLNLPQLVTGAFIGLPLGWLYWRFRSTLPCMLLHAGHNGLTLIAALTTQEDVAATDLPLLAWVVALLCTWAGIQSLRSLSARLRQSGDDAGS